MTSQTTFSKAEQEAIILNAVWSMIDRMVNFAIFMPLNGKTNDVILLPKTSETLHNFHILLGDFLSPLVRKGNSPLPFDLATPLPNTRRSNFTFLFYLRQICEDPHLNTNSQGLHKVVAAFSDWLEQNSFIENVWFPSVEIEINLTLPRITWLKISADIAKHSFARLEANVRKIVHIFNDHGHSIDEGMGYAVLPEFWDWFHTDLFAYHSSTIAEFLNNIRWEIFRYLQPEFSRAYHITSDNPLLPSYAYHVPLTIRASIARSMYWDLMNSVRSKPYFPVFAVTDSLKQLY